MAASGNPAQDDSLWLATTTDDQLDKRGRRAAAEASVQANSRTNGVTSLPAFRESWLRLTPALFALSIAICGIGAIATYLWTLEHPFTNDSMPSATGPPAAARPTIALRAKTDAHSGLRATNVASLTVDHPDVSGYIAFESTDPDAQFLYLDGSENITCTDSTIVISGSDVDAVARLLRGGTRLLISTAFEPCVQTMVHSVDGVFAVKSLPGYRAVKIIRSVVNDTLVVESEALDFSSHFEIQINLQSVSKRSEPSGKPPWHGLQAIHNLTRRGGDVAPAEIVVGQNVTESVELTTSFPIKYTLDGWTVSAVTGVSVGLEHHLDWEVDVRIRFAEPTDYLFRINGYSVVHLTPSLVVEASHTNGFSSPPVAFTDTTRILDVPVVTFEGLVSIDLFATAGIAGSVRFSGTASVSLPTKVDLFPWEYTYSNGHGTLTGGQSTHSVSLSYSTTATIALEVTLTPGIGLGLELLGVPVIAVQAAFPVTFSNALTAFALPKAGCYLRDTLSDRLGVAVAVVDPANGYAQVGAPLVTATIAKDVLYDECWVNATTATTSPPPTTTALPSTSTAAASATGTLLVRVSSWAQYRNDTETVGQCGSRRPAWCSRYAYRSDHVLPLVSAASGVSSLLLVYSFLAVNSDGTVASVEPNDYDQLQSLAALKALNPNVRVLVSVGGWNFCTAQGPFLGTGSDAVFPAVALSPELTANLLRSVVSFCETHGLDGVDIDWEDAVSPNIARLAAALKSGLASKGLLLTVTLPGQYQSLQRLDLAALSQSSDLISLVASDFHGAFDDPPTTIAHTPVVNCDAADSPRVDNGFRWDVNSAVQFAYSQGVPMRKVAVGLATSGRSSSSAVCGPCTQSRGLLAEYEIRDSFSPFYLVEDGPTDPRSLTVSTTIQGNYYSYDNAESHRMKMCFFTQLGISSFAVLDADTDFDLHLTSAILHTMEDISVCQNVNVTASAVLNACSSPNFIPITIPPPPPPATTATGTRTLVPTSLTTAPAPIPQQTHDGAAVTVPAIPVSSASVTIAGTVYAWSAWVAAERARRLAAFRGGQPAAVGEGECGALETAAFAPSGLVPERLEWRRGACFGVFETGEGGATTYLSMATTSRGWGTATGVTTATATVTGSARSSGWRSYAAYTRVQLVYGVVVGVVVSMFLKSGVKTIL